MHFYLTIDLGEHDKFWGDKGREILARKLAEAAREIALDNVNDGCDVPEPLTVDGVTVGYFGFTTEHEIDLTNPGA